MTVPSVLAKTTTGSFFAAKKLLAERRAGISDTHGDALRSIEGEAARIAKAGALKLFTGRRKTSKTTSPPAVSVSSGLTSFQGPGRPARRPCRPDAAGAAASHASIPPPPPPPQCPVGTGNRSRTMKSADRRAPAGAVVAAEWEA